MKTTAAPVAIGAALMTLAVQRPAHAEPSAEQHGQKSDSHELRTGVDVVPFAGGDSDIGWGLGIIGDVTRWTGGDSKAPYAWRIEGSLFGTFKFGPLALGYQDHWIRWILSDVGKGVRLELRPSFTQESNVHYYGLGNGAPAPAPGGDRNPSSTYYQYGRTHPEFLVLVRKPLAPHWEGVLGDHYSQNGVDIAPRSQLATDLRSQSAEVRSLLQGAKPGGVNLFQAGVSFDTRDSEIVTHHGTLDEVTVRVSPGIGDALPYTFGEVLLSFCAFVPLGSRVVMAGRWLGDGLVGHPPIWQLASYSSTSAIGGTLGVRGVPAQRYYGKIKALQNIEGRFDVWTFHLFDKDWTLATAAFFDVGRVWADWRGGKGLDGTGPGLHWGVGGGLRLEQGNGLVVRADVAWSPDALPIAGYFAAGEIF